MSEPLEPDFALVKIGDGGSPEAFTILCGLTGVTINETAQSQDRFVPDCAKPGQTPKRKQRITGMQLDISGTGLVNVPQIPTFRAAIGQLTSYKVELYAKDGTDAGELLGTYAMASKMTAFNIGLPQDGSASAEITLPSHGSYDYEAA